MQGCVNKVSLFDKDLMFVVIFGLRGFKHELDSQIGLRCATECYHAITAVKGVKTTSVAVTTGRYSCLKISVQPKPGPKPPGFLHSPIVIYK